MIEKIFWEKRGKVSIFCYKFNKIVRKVAEREYQLEINFSYKSKDHKILAFLFA